MCAANRYGDTVVIGDSNDTNARPDASEACRDVTEDIMNEPPPAFVVIDAPDDDVTTSATVGDDAAAEERQGVRDNQPSNKPDNEPDRQPDEPDKQLVAQVCFCFFRALLFYTNMPLVFRMNHVHVSLATFVAGCANLHR